MANRTVKDAVSIKGTNPQYLIEKIVRSRIYDCRYWKEDCFALTAELMVDKAMELKYIGGTFGGNIKPTPFLCLILKMLQIQPEKDIIVEFIRNEDFKYVRYLGAFYMRLTGTAVDVYSYLEPLYIDYRKMKRLNRQGKFELMHMDELIDELLHNDRVLDIAMPRLQKRHVLEDLNQLEIRVSPLEGDLESSESEEEEEEEVEVKKKSVKKERHDDRRRPRSPVKDDSRSSRPSNRKKYVDYDRPDAEPQEYKHEPQSPTRHREHKRRERSKSRSRSRDKKHRSKHRHRSRSRSHDNERDRDRSSRKHEKKHKRSRSRESRSKSRERKDKKR